MAHCCAAVLQTCRRRQVQAWFYILTWQAMASAESPSCTGLTATTNCHPSPCLETLPLLENCELFTSQPLTETNCCCIKSTTINCVLVCVSVRLCSMVFTLYFRHGEDLIVTPFAQVRTEYKSIKNKVNLLMFFLISIKTSKQHCEALHGPRN